MTQSADERLVVMLEARISDFEKRMRQAERTGSDSYRRLRRGSQSATAGMEQDMLRSTDRINQAIASTSSQIGTLGKAFLGGFLGGAAFAAISQGISATRRLAGEIATVGDEARRAGMSAQAFQQWKFVAEQNRIGVDALVDGFKELSLRADEFILTGQGSGAEAFQRLGYSAEELQEKLKDPSALMLEIIGRLGQLDKAAQIRIADELFGGSGGERFVELLAQGEQGIRRTMDRANELGVVMSDELIAKAAEVDRQFNAIANTVGTALKSAIVSAASSLSDFLDGFRAFQDQRDSTLLARQSEIMQEKVRLNELLKTSPGGRNGNRRSTVINQRLRDLNTEEDEIIGILSARQDATWKPRTDTWTAPTPTGAVVPGNGSSGKGNAKTARPDEFATAVAGVKEQTAALNEQAASFDALATSGRTYAEAVDYANTRADLLMAAHKAGIQITPELEAQIDALADSYVVAGQRAEEAADRMRQIEENAQRGASAVGDVFLAALDGADAAKQAVAQLLAELARAQTMKAFASLAGMGGTTGSIFSGLGEMLSFDGGGYTGSGNRAGGLDGKGGFLAMLHPRETVVDHTKGQQAAAKTSAQVTANFNINLEGARGDAGIREIARRAVADGLSEFSDALPTLVHGITSGNEWIR